VLLRQLFSRRRRETQNERIRSVTLTHETRSPTPPDKQKKVRLFSRARMFPSLEFALAFATTGSRSSGFIRDPAHIRTVSPFFCLFFCGLSCLSLVFWICGVSRRRASKKKRIERERERKNKRKDDLSLEIKTDDSMRDARDSSARRTIFGSRALPLSPLSDLIIFLVRFPLTHLLRSHPGTLAHLIILYL